MVIDDDEVFRELVGEILEGENYRVIGAANGAEALQYLKTSPPPRLILLDMVMPEMDGSALQKELAQDPVLASIPIVAITAIPTHLMPDLSHTTLNKPVHLDKLLVTVNRYVNGPMETDAVLPPAVMSPLPRRINS